MKCRYIILTVSILAVCFVFSGQAGSESSHSSNQAVLSENISQAVAVLHGTQGNNASGEVRFQTVEGGVRVTGKFSGLAPGKHGFHIHEKGDCSAPDGSSAGGHYNPLGKSHGEPDATERHAGDLGNITADKSGHALYDRVDSQLSLNGPYSIVGRSVIIHAGEDDLKSQPTGNAGARVACGVIEIEAK